MMSLERIAEIEAEIVPAGFIWLLRQCSDGMANPEGADYFACISDRRGGDPPGWRRFFAYADTPMGAFEGAYARWKSGEPSDPGGWT